MSHLGKAVPESALALCEAEQTPFFDTATEDFPVALLLGGKGLPKGGRGSTPAGWPADRQTVSRPAARAAWHRPGPSGQHHRHRVITTWFNRGSTTSTSAACKGW